MGLLGLRVLTPGAAVFLGLLNPEDGGIEVLRNIGNYLRIHMVSHSRMLEPYVPHHCAVFLIVLPLSLSLSHHNVLQGTSLVQLFPLGSGSHWQHIQG